MKFSVFDADVEHLAQWHRIAGPCKLDFQGFVDLSELQSLAEEDTQIVAIDQSVAKNLPLLIADCCSHFRNHLFIATGSQITIPMSAQIMSLGAAWVFTQPLCSVEFQQTYPMILRNAESVHAKLIEFRELLSLFRTLTERERIVMDRVIDGVANKEVADELKISIRTVEARRARCYQKLAADNMVQLVRKVDRLESLRQQFKCKTSGKGRQSFNHHMHRKSDQTEKKDAGSDDHGSGKNEC